MKYFVSYQWVGFDNSYGFGRADLTTSEKLSTIEEIAEVETQLKGEIKGCDNVKNVIILYYREM